MVDSVNPATGEVVASLPGHDEAEVERRLAAVVAAQKGWRTTGHPERAERMHRLAAVLERRRRELAILITTEMGKPITEAEAEIGKCAWACTHFADHAGAMLAPEPIDGVDGARVVYEPLGVVLAVMPWNFPFWQAIRMIAPGLMAGNGVVLKHASNVPRCALAIEEAVAEAGFPEGLQRTVLVPGSAVDGLLADPRIAAVSLTGSTEVGGLVASRAGSLLKPQVLELGGSDPFLVCDDVDVTTVAGEAAKARTVNSGQSCIAAKRFIVAAGVADEFTTRFTEAVAALRVGDPMEPDTDIGPLARPDLVETLANQVDRSVADGAGIATGGHPLDRPGNWYPPTVLTGVTRHMPVFAEETFGPVAAVTVAGDLDEMVDLANDTVYGLGAGIWTADPDRGAQIAARLDAGSVFVNAKVASDPRLPFGGVKRSGYGRELGTIGIRELTRIKTIHIAS